MKTLLNLFFFIILSVFFVACGGSNDMKNLDVNFHRNYQDSVIDNSKTYSDRISSTKRIISEYVNLNYVGKDTSSFYYYLVARAYSKGIEPLNFIVYDTINKRVIDPNFYRICVDSTLYYTEKSLKLDSNNIFSMNLLTLALREEMYNYEVKKAEGVNLPYSFKRDSNTWNDRINYVLNHAINFTANDTTTKKLRSRYIIETALVWLSSNFENYSLSSLNDNQNIKTLLVAEKYIEYLKNFNNEDDWSISKSDFISWQNKLAPILMEYNRLQAEIEGQEYSAQKRMEEVSPVDLGTFETMTQDLGAMTWDQANTLLSQMGNGWRLPDLFEINKLFVSMNSIGGFIDGESYWSSELHKNKDPYYQVFNTDYADSQVPHQYYGWRGEIYRVRAVRDKK
jgi:hypothetical protein